MPRRAPQSGIDSEDKVVELFRFPVESLNPFRFGSCGRFRVASWCFLYSSRNLSVARSVVWI